MIGESVTIHRHAAIFGRFGEALQDARRDSGKQGIISESRKKIKGQGKIT